MAVRSVVGVRAAAWQPECRTDCNITVTIPFRFLPRYRLQLRSAIFRFKRLGSPMSGTELVKTVSRSHVLVVHIHMKHRNFECGLLYSFDVTFFQI